MLSILYVEDEIEVRNNYCFFLQEVFDEVYEATDGEEAWELFLEHRPKMLLVDISIPKLNGLDLIKRIRDENPNIPITILSAHSDKENLLSAIKLNLVDYLVKPVSRSAFKQAVLEMINRLTEDNRIHLCENYYWDLSTSRLFCDTEIILLTKSEEALLELLTNNKNRIFKDYEIYSHIWDAYEKEYNSGSVRNLVNKLRKRTSQEIIQNIYGRGYCLNS